MEIRTDSTELWDNKVSIKHGAIKLTIANGEKCLYITCEKGVQIDKLSAYDAIIRIREGV